MRSLGLEFVVTATIEVLFLSFQYVATEMSDMWKYFTAGCKCLNKQFRYLIHLDHSPQRTWNPRMQDIILNSPFIFSLLNSSHVEDGCYSHTVVAVDDVIICYDPRILLSWKFLPTHFSTNSQKLLCVKISQCRVCLSCIWHYIVLVWVVQPPIPPFLSLHISQSECDITSPEQWCHIQ